MKFKTAQIKTAQIRSAAEFTVCVLLYGDYPRLAERCLGSLVSYLPPGAQLRIGMNECCAQTIGLVRRIKLHPGFASVRVFQSTSNVHKYPLMRRMFHEPSMPLTTPFVMWFDDDSFLLPSCGSAWLDRVHARMQAADMLGSLYGMPQRGGQYLWVRDQPWYNGLPIDAHHQFVFATGGWWTIRAEILRRFDWPLPQLDHCGGDVMLGELCRQRYLRLEHFNDGVAINADSTGVESSAPRRGFGAGIKPIGVDYVPPSPTLCQSQLAQPSK
jgi:hypothetical protein